MARKSVMLESGWRFQPDPENAGEGLGYWQDGYDASRWREISVPCGLEQAHPDLEWYMGTGWYRRVFHVPAAWQGQRVALRFEGVNYHARVWVNGTLVGSNQDGFLPFQFAIEGLVRYGQENTLVVMADNEARLTEVPGTSVGWRPYGGILRQVALLTSAPCSLDAVRIVAEPAPDGAGRLSLQAWASNIGSDAQTVTLEVTVLDAASAFIGTVASEAVEVAPGTQTELTVAGLIGDVQPWAPDAPTLYTARTRLLRDAEALDAVVTRFGFRSVATETRDVLLNGQPIYLMGFNRHEDTPDRGGCTDLATVRRDLQDMVTTQLRPVACKLCIGTTGCGCCQHQPMATQYQSTTK
jgi:beta-galactosidase/beta-glucuronidase